VEGQLGPPISEREENTMLILKGSLLGLVLSVGVMALYFLFLFVKFGGPGMFDVGFYRRLATLFLGIAIGTLLTCGGLFWLSGALTKYVAALR
jgi:hypothetical protein